MSSGQVSLYHCAHTLERCCYSGRGKEQIKWEQISLLLGKALSFLTISLVFCYCVMAVDPGANLAGYTLLPLVSLYLPPKRRPTYFPFPLPGLLWDSDMVAHEQTLWNISWSRLWVLKFFGIFMSLMLRMGLKNNGIVVSTDNNLILLATAVLRSSWDIHQGLKYGLCCHMLSVSLLSCHCWILCDKTSWKESLAKD